MFVYRTISVKDLGHVLHDTGRFASISLFAIGTASIFRWLLAFYDVPRLIVDTLVALDVSPFTTKLIIAALFLFCGLVIPPYGLCLLISAAIAGLNVVSVLKDVVIILIPEIALWLPRLLVPKSIQ